MSGLCAELPPRGFSFDNCKRNNFLLSKGYAAPKPLKTGTTIVGVIYKDGVILGADRRATCNNIIAVKDVLKLHHMSDKIYCAGAGTSADCTQVTKMVRSQLALHELNTNRPPRVATVSRIVRQHLYRYQGHISAALIVGGMDVDGPHLYSISPGGASFRFPYITMGSGSLNAVAVLERGWKPDMDLESARKLVRDAVTAGILNDMASGSTVSLVVINEQGADLIPSYDVVCAKGEHATVYKYPKGATPVLSTQVIPFEIESNEVTLHPSDEPMDM